MAKFNRPGVRPATSSPVTTEARPSTRTHEGAAGYVRDAKGELFVLAVGNFVSERTFYEAAGARDDRFTALVRHLAVEDPQWTAQLLIWVRSAGHLRSAAVVGAAEFVHARLAHRKEALQGAGANTPYTHAELNRQVIAGVLQRPDEPGELLAYWMQTYGRALPMPVKRGIADAVRRLYNEKALLKYDTGEGFRFGDVLDLTHPAPDPGKRWQGELFRHALDRRHGRDTIPELPMLLARQALMETPPADRRTVLRAPDGPARLNAAGMTWEALAGWLQGPMDAEAWEAIIPSMGVMAMIRNLRNFDQAGVSDTVAQHVAGRLADAEEVRRSRALPFRFLAAYRAAPSLRWAWPLQQALDHSLTNIPALTGRSLVLVDRSPSMWMAKFSERSDMPWADAAAVFGAALAVRAEHADLVEFGIHNGPVAFARGESTLKIVERFRKLNGTDIPSAVRDHLRPHHDRVIIVTDEQTRPGFLPSNANGYRIVETPIDDVIPKTTPLYMWNFGGYKPGATPSGGAHRHTFGGLSDAAFPLIPLLEAGKSATWPWLN